MPSIRTTVAIIPLILAYMGSASADTLTMPAQDNRSMQRVSVDSMDLPVKGQTMNQVESAFGTPQQKLQAVGEPPITRWVYGFYTVYFEDRFVIHSVVHP